MSGGGDDMCTPTGDGAGFGIGSQPLMPPTPMGNAGLHRGSGSFTDLTLGISGGSFNATPSSHGKMPPTPQRNAIHNTNPKQRLTRQDTLLDTKVLYTSPLCRQRSSSNLFTFDAHFQNWVLIGQGSFSEVYKVKSVGSASSYAVKKSRREFSGRGDRDRYMQEIEAIQQIPEHSNIVRYFRAWQDELHFFVQMELCTGGTLRDYLDMNYGPLATKPVNMCLNIQTNVLLCFMHQLSQAVSHIHANDILHMDLKPENVFMDGPNKTVLKVGDFGNSVRVGGFDDEDGDPIYLAPEVLQGIAIPASDVFSLGLIFFEMATRHELPNGGEQWHWLRSGNVTLQTSEANKQGWPDRIDELILPMLQPRYEERPSAEQVEHALNMMQLPPAPPALHKEITGPFSAASSTSLGQMDVGSTSNTQMDEDL